MMWTGNRPTTTIMLASDGSIRLKYVHPGGELRETLGAAPAQKRRSVSSIGSIIDGDTTAGLSAASPLGLLAILLLIGP
jgi:hypothetical protein